MERTNSTATAGGEATSLPGDTRFREVTEDGVDYLVAPVVAQVEDVYAYRTNDGVTREFLPAEELTGPLDEWEGAPLLLRHPTDTNGNAVLTDHPEADPVEVGSFRDVRANDSSLPGEVWVRAAEVGAHDGDLASYVERVNNGGYGEVSTGYDLEDLEQTPGRHNGQSYDAVQRGVQPDHLALLVDNRGNCPVDAGECGVGRANEASVRTNHTLRNPRLHAVTETADATADTTESAVERLAARLNRLLGSAEDAPPESADVSDSDTADEQPSDEPAESGRDNATATSHMHDDDKIDELVELGYDRANLEQWKGEDCLSRLHEQATAPDTDADESTEGTESAGTDSEQTMTETETETEPTADTESGSDTAEVDIDTLAEKVAAQIDTPSADDLAKEVDAARANQRNIEAVVNADAHPFDRDDLEAMDPDHVAKLADSVPEDTAQTEQRANYGGIPTGPSVDLSDEGDDMDGLLPSRGDDE
jgi:hypothetical protein